MELKTKIRAEAGQQELFITREFDLPVRLLFRAYTEPTLVEQWMGTKVIKLNAEIHGSYLFETTDPLGNKHLFHGTIHDYVPGQKITRTFEMANTVFPAQLEFLVFTPLTPETCQLTIQIIYKSAAFRDQMLKLPFAQGLNMAHNRLEQTVKQLSSFD